MKQKSLKINAALNFIRNFAGLLFPLITFPYTSRVLLPEGVGKVNFAQSIISYFGLIALLGITNYGIREAAKVRDDKVKLSQISKELLTINLISTFVSYVLFAVSIFLVPKFYEYRILLCVTGATIIFTTLGMEWLYTAIEEFRYITIRYLIIQVVAIIMIFIFVKTKEDYLKFAGITVIAGVGSNVANFIYSKKFIDFRLCSKLKLRQHLKPIFVLFVMALAVQFYNALDTTMLGFIAGEWHVGIYSVATKINKVVLSAIVGVSSVMLPRLSYYSQKEDKSDYTNLAYKGIDFLLLIAVPSTLGLCLLSKEIILLIGGQEYLSAVSAMRIMNPIIIITGLSNFLGIQIFMTLNKEKITLFSVIAGAVTNLILNLILIPKYQVLGAAIATISAETMITLVQLYFAHDIISYKYVLKKLAIYLFNSVIMAVPIILCVYFINANWILILGSLFVSVLLYFLLLLIEKNQFVMTTLVSITKRIKK